MISSALLVSNNVSASYPSPQKTTGGSVTCLDIFRSAQLPFSLVIYKERKFGFRFRAPLLTHVPLAHIWTLVIKLREQKKTATLAGALARPNKLYLKAPFIHSKAPGHLPINRSIQDSFGLIWGGGFDLTNRSPFRPISETLRAPMQAHASLTKWWRGKQFSLVSWDEGVISGCHGNAVRASRELPIGAFFSFCRKRSTIVVLGWDF